MLKIIVFDIETHGFQFKADAGFIFCMSYKYLDSKEVHHIVRKNVAKNPLDDKQVCREIYKVLSEADMWITHNGKRFDVPFIQSRLLANNLPPLPPVPHFDTCEVAFKRLRQSGKLINIGKFLKLKVGKYNVEMTEWLKAACGDPKPLKEIVKHCDADVLLLEAVYLKFRALGFKHPNLNVIESDGKLRCPYCRSTKVQRRGFQAAQVRKARRYQCQNCSGWSHGRYESIGDVGLR